MDLKETLENQESFNELAERLEFTAEQYSKKLMGQLIFLYFLQKKGWLGVRANPTRVEAVDIEDLIYTNQEQEIFHRVYKLHNGLFIRNGNELKNLSDKEIEVLNNIFRNTKYAEKWGQGEINFIRRIFNAAKDSEENFFKDYLEPLFYEALNDKRGGSTYYKKLNCLIPFLNGGLFKTINADYEWKDTHFVLKNNVFSNETLCKNGDIGDGILDVFDRYAFTVNEAEPLETDVAVDPEMLGKVFENLLDIKDRKSKGAFYTPREIVHYMCQESLINYLQTETQISYEDIEQLIRYGDIIADDDKSKNAQKTGKYLMPEAIRANSKKIDELLKNVKIADPAVGSGAFPLGMVNEILRARSNLNPYIYGTEISLYGNKFSIPMDRRPYQIKLDTIQNCIHAVDIEPSAVDIAKLRLWLSLIVDEENFKEIRPLPNLDYNIMCGNSLIDEFQGVKLFDERILDRTIGEKKDEAYEQIELLPVDKYDQLDIFGESNASRIMNEIRKLQKEFFSCVDENQRIEIKNKIDEYEFEFVKETLKENNQQDKIKDIEAMWKKNTKPYFLWKLYFADVFLEKGGFDIVIGNPPYVGESGNKEIFRPIAQTEFGKKYYQGKMDLFYFFFHIALDIGNKYCEIALITTNYYPTAFGAKKLRKDIKQRSNIRKLINFNELKIFDSAKGQHNMITMLTKNREKDIVAFTGVYCKTGIANPDIISSIVSLKDKNTIYNSLGQQSLYEGMDSYIRLNGNNIESENPINNVLNKIAMMNLKLGDIVNINQGVVTGCDYVSKRNIMKIEDNNEIKNNDGIFVFDLENGRDVIAINNLNNERILLRNFYKNSDIKKYWCSATLKKKILYYQNKLEEKKYPKVFKHLKKFEDILKFRLTTYGESYHWTCIHRAREEDIFINAKIVVPYRSKTNAFAYNEVEWFCRSDVYIITQKNKEYSLKYLLALLNSKTYYIWLYYRGKRKGEILEMFQAPLCEIPILNISENEQKKYIKIVDKILNITKKESYISSAEDHKEVLKYREIIDNMIYKEMLFNDKEIAVIENHYKEG